MKRDNLPGFSASRALAGGKRAVVPAADGMFTRLGPEYYEKCRPVFDDSGPVRRVYLDCRRRYIWPGHPQY
jgi:hypothetical protein